jgi:hypothetical protein
VKSKLCKNCKEKFTPDRPLQAVCGYKCANEYAKKQREKQAKKEWVKEKKMLKEKLLTHSDYIQLIQKVFNTYIRKRDAGKPCISCNRPLINKFDAGHFYAAGSNPAIRFHEDNVHGQCVHCNRDKHGNLLEYREGLIKRIGMIRFLELEDLKFTKTSKYSIDELKDLIKFYKLKIKQLEQK